VINTPDIKFYKIFLDTISIHTIINNLSVALMLVMHTQQYYALCANMIFKNF